MIKLNNYLKGENNVKLEDLKGKKDNDNFLLEKEIKKRALSLNPEEKEKMIILKPKNAFCSSYKPCPINKLFWEKINETFGLEPEGGCSKDNYDRTEVFNKSTIPLFAKQLTDNYKLVTNI